MAEHVVQPGEYISLIADGAGFRDYETVWDDGGNGDLREVRDNPGVLLAGDSVFVPDKQQKKVDRPTGAHHVFRVKGDKLWLRIILLDFDDQPIANAACSLTVEDTVWQLTTDGDGRIDQAVPRNSRKGLLRVPDLDLELALDIGMLDPVDIEAGWKARLANLGYYHGDAGDPDHDNEQWGWSLEEFQCDHALDVTGQPDDATRAKLREIFGS
jgi:hypothetical protein